MIHCKFCHNDYTIAGFHRDLCLHLRSAFKVMMGIPRVVPKCEKCVKSEASTLPMNMASGKYVSSYYHFTDFDYGADRLNRAVKKIMEVNYREVLEQAVTR